MAAPTPQEILDQLAIYYADPRLGRNGTLFFDVLISVCSLISGGGGGGITPAQVEAAIEAASNLQSLLSAADLTALELAAGATDPLVAPSTNINGSLRDQLKQLNSTLAGLTTSGWTPDAVSDSDPLPSKTFTVPATTIWQVMAIWVQYVSDATVGNRQITVEILDNSNAIWQTFKAPIVQPESLTLDYNFSPQEQNTNLVDITQAVCNLAPTLIIPEGWQIRVGDTSTVSGADTANVRILLGRRVA
jgi:hypothetical protein